MIDTDEPYIRSSQEPLITLEELCEDNDDIKHVYSTQELNLIQTQEALEAFDYLNKVAITSSQESASVECVVAMSDNSDGEQSNLSYAYSTVTATESRSSQIEDNVVDSPVKKKRGRKRKIWTAEEWDEHRKAKKEKNRIAAKRLRRRKCDESKDYKQTEQTLAEKIKQNKARVDKLNTKCKQFRKLLGCDIRPET